MTIGITSYQKTQMSHAFFKRKPVPRNAPFFLCVFVFFVLFFFFFFFLLFLYRR